MKTVRLIISLVLLVEVLIVGRNVVLADYPQCSCWYPHNSAYGVIVQGACVITTCVTKI